MADLRLLVLSSFICITFAASPLFDPEWKTFADDDEPKAHLTLLVAVDNVTGDVFMAAVNNLYHLDSDLVLKKKVATGPQRICATPSTTCDNMTLAINYPRCLSLVYHLEQPYVMLCGSLYDGLCQLRPLRDLDRVFWVGPYDDPVSRFSKYKEDPAFFGPGYGNQTVLYSGTDWHPEKAGLLPFFSSKVLERRNEQFQFRYSYKSNSTLSALFFQHPHKQVLLYSFSHGSYVYLLYIRVRGETVAETVLARICIEDGTFTSYVEVRLSCQDDPIFYELGMLAYFGPGFKNGEPEPHLYVVFKNHSTGICSFSIRDLNTKFDAAVEDCFGEGTTANTMDLKTANLQKCQSKKGAKDFCGSSLNPYIISNQFIASKPTYSVYNLRDFRITSLLVHEENKRIVGFLGTKVSLFIKALLDVPGGTNKNTMLHLQLVKGDEIQPSIAFDLKQEHVYFLHHNKIEKFPARSCSIYKTCFQCFEARHDPLECGWCNGKCVTRQKCPDEFFSRSNCTPSIESVTPSVGSTVGGTHLVITGKNFGTRSPSTENSVTVNNKTCLVLYWEMERIMCVTRPSPEEGLTTVVVSVRDDSNKTLGFIYAGIATNNKSLSYVTPKIKTIIPDRGSVNGGTNVTIYGDHLDIGRSYSMNIRRRNCTNLKVHAVFATCITGTSEDKKLNDAIELIMDNVPIAPEHASSDPSQIFQYMEDPHIYEIHPTDTVLSFRGNVTVSGLNLNNAKDPFMLLSIFSSEGRKIKFSQRCWQNPGSNGNAMMCPIPVLDSNSITFPKDGQPLIAQVNFSMSPFKENFPELKLAQLSFYPEPEFRKNHSIVRNHTSLEIKGKYPGSGSLAYLTSVQIGENDPCNVSKLTSDTLYCEFDPELLTNTSISGKNLSVKVFTGSSHHNVGYLMISELEIEEPLVQRDSLPVILSSVLVGLLLVTALVVWWCFRWRCQRKCPNVLVKVPSVMYSNDFRRNQDGMSSDCMVDTTARQPLIRSFSRQPSSTATTSQSSNSALTEPSISENTVTRPPLTTSRQPPYILDNRVNKPPLMPSSTQPHSHPDVTRLPTAASSPPISTIDDTRPPLTMPKTSRQSPSTLDDTITRLPSIPVKRPISNATRVVPDIPKTSPIEDFSHPGYLGMEGRSNVAQAPIQSIASSPCRESQIDSEENLLSLDDTLRILAQDGYIIRSEDLIVGAEVGSGQFGSVFIGEYYTPKKARIEVAVKAILDGPDVTQTTVKEFIDEAYKMKEFRHENVLQLIGVCFAGSNTLIVLPYMNKGDLCSYLRNENNRILKMDLLKFATQVAAGMAYLSQQKFVHRDLATRNCLISGEDKVKIADFGLSRDIYEGEYYRIASTTRKLPYRWMAPECMELNIFTVKSDVWSYGILLWEIMTLGVIPYEAIHNWAILDHLKAGQRLPCPEYCSEIMYKEGMLRCWEYDASKRPSFELLHSFAKQQWASASYKDRIQPVRAENKTYINFKE